MPTPTTSTTPVPSATSSAEASPSPTDSASAGGYHFDPALEDLLPSQVAGMDLGKASLPLSSYLTSVSGADKDLYTTWLEKLGISADKATIAVAVGGTDQSPFRIVAFKFPGTDANKLFTAFHSALTSNNWASKDKAIATKIVVEATDPSNGAVGDVYFKNDVAYVILADNPSLVAEALILLP